MNGPLRERRKPRHVVAREPSCSPSSTFSSSRRIVEKKDSDLYHWEDHKEQLKKNVRRSRFRVVQNMWMGFSSASLLSSSEPSTKDMKRNNKSLKRSWRAQAAILRLTGFIFLARFLWEIYMLHTASWSEQMLIPQPMGSDFQRRFLGHFHSRKSLRADASTPFPTIYSLNAQYSTRMKRPPPFVPEGDKPDQIVRLITPKRNDIVHESHDWPKLCKAARLGKSSRVLVTDVIRQSTASTLALMMAQHCGVRIVVGTDELFPNLRLARVRYMQIFKKLFQKITNFRLIVTDNGLRRPTEEKQLSWLLDLDPTHVIVSDHLVDDQDVSTATSKQNYQLYTETHNVLVWKHLFDTLAKRRNDKTKSPRIVHLATMAPSSYHGPHAVAGKNVGHLIAAHFKQNVTRVTLPRFYGPGTTLLTQIDNPRHHFDVFFDNSPHVHVDDGFAALLLALQRTDVRGYADLKIPQSLVLSSAEIQNSRRGGDTRHSPRMQRAVDWNDHLQAPFGRGKGEILRPSSELQDLFTTQTRMPCASQCTSQYIPCEPSAFDEIVPTSRNVTAECKFIVYMGNFSEQLEAIPPAAGPGYRGLCRIAFVSKSSKLVHGLVHKTQRQQQHPQQDQNYDRTLADANGRMNHNGWILMWPSLASKSFNVGDASLLRIDPSRLFAPTVEKALFLGSTFDAYARISGKQAMMLLAQVDERGFKQGERAYRQHRSGTHLSRWVHLDASQPRHATLMGGSAFSTSVGPVSPSIFVRGANHSKKQLFYYQQLAHWVHTNQGRPQFEVDSTIFKTFPFEWIAPFFLVHNLEMEQARLLRCEWLEEHLSWGAEQVVGQLEELSLGYIVGRRKTIKLLGADLDNSFHNDGWVPFLKHDREGEAVVDNRGAEVFIHLLKRHGSTS